MYAYITNLTKIDFDWCGAVQVIIAHMSKIAGAHVRGAGSLAGNLMMVCTAHSVYLFGYCSISAYQPFLFDRLTQQYKQRENMCHPPNTHINRNTHTNTKEPLVPILSVTRCRKSVSQARHWGFESDLATVFMAAGATLELIRIDGASISAPTTMTLEEFFAIPKTEQVIIKAVTVPWSDPSEVMRTYKVALRPQNSHALVNAGFRIRSGADGTISAATLVYGAVGTPHAVHASAAEKFMVGRTLKALSTDKDQRVKLFSLLGSEIPVPSLGSAKADAVHRVTYRRGLVTAFMSKFLSEPSSPSLGPDVMCAAPGGYTRRVSVATQSLPGIDTGAPMTDDWYTEAPVGLPVPKLSARLQASGEAKYTADGPLPNRTAYGAFAQAYAVGRTVTALQTEKAMASPGVIRIVTAKDIRGENNSVFGGSSVERLLVELGGDPVKYAGEPVCIVVAATKQEAHEAAALVTVTYEKTSVPPATPDAAHPPTNLRDAIKHKVFLKRNDKACHHERHDSGCATLTDALDACAHVVTGEVELGTQKHFPIETHTAVAIPDEGGRMKVCIPTTSFDLTIIHKRNSCLHSSQVWSSCQGIACVQTGVARVLYGPKADCSLVHVKCRRVGGGFGAKLSRHLPVACAAALAAQASRRPVLMAITRAQDMEMTGGRHDTIAQYSAGYDKSGRILALRIAVHMDSGWSPGQSVNVVEALV